jgi:flagellar hook-basal body complex protein FliE
MTLFQPVLKQVQSLELTATDPRHIQPGGAAHPASGTAIVNLGSQIGASAVLDSTDTSGTLSDFSALLLRSLDSVSADQSAAETVAQMAITDPGSVDIQDITIAQAKASMSLTIAQTILSRLVQGWKDVINTR